MMEQIAVRCAPFPGEFLISVKLPEGEFAVIFCPRVFLDFFFPSLLLIAQGVHQQWFNLTCRVVASSFIVITFLVKRLTVVPSLLGAQ